jgi:hypothetical protein
MNKIKLLTLLLVLSTVGCQAEQGKTIYTNCVPTEETRVIVDRTFARNAKDAGMPYHQRKHECVTGDNKIVYEWMGEWAEDTTTQTEE